MILNVPKTAQNPAWKPFEGKNQAWAGFEIEIVVAQHSNHNVLTYWSIVKYSTHVNITYVLSDSTSYKPTWQLKNNNQLFYSQLKYSTEPYKAVAFQS